MESTPQGERDMDSCSPTVRVLLADDQTLFRVGLARLLEADPRVEIIGGAADGAEAVLLAGGMANKQIAYQLMISDKTVRNHVSNMYEKLNVYDRTQAALYAVRKGLIEP